MVAGVPAKKIMTNLNGVVFSVRTTHDRIDSHSAIRCGFFNRCCGNITPCLCRDTYILGTNTHRLRVTAMARSICGKSANTACRDSNAASAAVPVEGFLLMLLLSAWRPSWRRGLRNSPTSDEHAGCEMRCPGGELCGAARLTTRSARKRCRHRTVRYGRARHRIERPRRSRRCRQCCR
jgi:hypothetical protein